MIRSIRPLAICILLAVIPASAGAASPPYDEVRGWSQCYRSDTLPATVTCNHSTIADNSSGEMAVHVRVESPANGSVPGSGGSEGYVLMKKTINVDLAGAERTFRAQVHIKPSSAEHTGPLYHELSGLQGVANAWLEFYVRVADNENCGSFGTRRTLLEVSDGQNMLADQTMQIEGTIACENGMTAGAIEVQGFLNAEANLGGFVVDKGVARVDIALLVESIEIL